MAEKSISHEGREDTRVVFDRLLGVVFDSLLGVVFDSLLGGIFLFGDLQFLTTLICPVHLLRVFLLGVLESNFPGDSLSNSTDMRIPTPYN